MKRSEMVNNILRDIINFSCVDHCLDKEDQLELAEMVLIGIEEAGMLPPKIEYGDNYINAIRDYYINDAAPTDASAYFHIWEPEDV